MELVIQARPAIFTIRAICVARARAVRWIGVVANLALAIYTLLPERTLEQGKPVVVSSLVAYLGQALTRKEQSDIWVVLQVRHGNAVALIRNNAIIPHPLTII